MNDNGNNNLRFYLYRAPLWSHLEQPRATKSYAAPFHISNAKVEPSGSMVATQLLLPSTLPADHTTDNRSTDPNKWSILVMSVKHTK